MPNHCVAAGCGNMPSDSVSLFRFPNIQICAVFGPDKLSERGWIGSLAWRVDCFDEIPALKQITGACIAVQHNRVLTSMALSSIDFQTQR